MHLDEIQSIFFQECEEGLAAIEVNLAEVRDAAPEAETINTIFRAVHSIKGGAGAFGFEALQGFAHHLETVLDLLRTNELTATPEITALLFAAFDVLSDHVAAAQGGEAPDDAATLARLEAAATSGAGGASRASEEAPQSAPVVADAGDPAMDLDLDSFLASIDAPVVAAAPWWVSIHPGLDAFGMVVSVGGQTYVIPLTHVVESLRPQPGDVRRFGPDSGVLDVRGAYLPILPVGRLLGVADACTEPTQAVLVVVETDAGQSILMVDGIQDQRQVVVKSLEANYAPVQALAGATVLGDGRVALILDVETLVRRHRGDHRAMAA